MFSNYPSFRQNIRRIFVKSAPVLSLLLLFSSLINAQQELPAAANPGIRVEEPTSQGDLWEELLNHDPQWYSSDEALYVADNILLYQRGSGGWPKNIDLLHHLTDAEKKELAEFINEPLATIDNGATYTQMRYLARVYRANKDQRYVLAFLKGLDYLLKAQYANGGWPQFYPLRSGYYTHITFNDDAMIGVLSLLRDIVRDRDKFDFVDENRCRLARQALDKGIDCTLKTQIRVDGQLTAWCAQHDEKSLKPVGARRYELPSLSGKETVGIVQFLMEIENPTPPIVATVQGAVCWLDEVRLEGIRVIRVPDPSSPAGFNKVVISDPEAPSMWARFYRIGSNRPFFSDRDGKIYEKLEEISSERRNDYGWLGYWPEEILAKHYPEWQKKWAPDDNVLNH